ncbi:uncharacterized protein LOC119075657 [Bradysia coprophila]|uniref:uncharacterized protein LOC119075657 n=1 Tax=Bradysia coprophila TaxID=38358 RepID=UPI00187D9FD2|nr:uncharacterized protein LOC119075657 [Bradysia coprophila]
MPGVVFLIVVPTANFERELVQDTKYEKPDFYTVRQPNHLHGNNLNINLPENNAVLRLEVELRDKNTRHRQNNQGGVRRNGQQSHALKDDINNYIVPMEKVLEELLHKLHIEHVTWSCDKKGNYHHVIFPLQSGDPCETTLHCLTELKIGINFGSSVSVLPCTVTYDALKDSNSFEEPYSDDEEYSKWNSFVDSIKSKLTVKQVVDGVRAGGALSFDYLLLILTADALAALGLIENNAPNITAAMLVSPLMGPVMSVTFGTIISDRELVKSGFLSLFLGMFISMVFGLIFGLIVGSTEMPWGFNDWPTEEMKGRGNVRNLWVAVLWALISGTGVAIALLQGAAGPLIGVAISASLLPPVVNCGLFWSLSCTWLLYDGVKLPHIKGEPYTGNSSYAPLYTNYMPTEFFINGIVSVMLTVVNVICIFTTAIIVLKIKEVAAPYTSSPDLRRFWETDIRTVRKANQSTIRRKNAGMKTSPFPNLNDPKNKNLESALEMALKEAVDDETFRKVKRMSYSNNAAEEITQRLGLSANGSGTPNSGGMNSLRNSKLGTDLSVLDKLVTSILERHQQQNSQSRLHRLRSLTRSRNNSLTRSSVEGGTMQSSTSTTMPTIMESNVGNNRPSSSWSERSIQVPGVRQIINTLTNAPHSFSQNSNRDDESTNMLD